MGGYKKQSGGRQGCGGKIKKCLKGLRTSGNVALNASAVGHLVVELLQLGEGTDSLEAMHVDDGVDGLEQSNVGKSQVLAVKELIGLDIAVVVALQNGLEVLEPPLDGF